MGCCYIGRGRFKKDNEIILDNDEDGNGRWGNITLKIEKDKIRIRYGTSLRKSERGKKWYYDKYASVDDLTDDIREFTYKYFRSFTTVRK